ncbi:hypothetical protein SAY87_026893 [Trapa incisa]|uniref:NAD(P)H-quinone oxidoreductase subunit L, chloroplastic n=1 Tax=Trapa incisa TaxID=236973 RepID=A0AAN7H1V8_9MYRT|nr:hypothetical protein SAY87_026893 [Trapa incisa]
MTASVSCIIHPLFSIKASSPSSPSLFNPLSGTQRVKLRRAGRCNWSRPKKWRLKLGENGGHHLDTDDSYQTAGRSFLTDLFSNLSTEKLSSASLLGALLATVELPAMAVTGVNNEEDLLWVLTQLAIVAFLYFLVAPPIIMNWLRIRWYRRNLLEMYLQFMFVFMFFPGVLLWAPFLNFRKFPRDPSMKYPWSVPEDPLQVKNSYLKYPFARPEDYD